MLAIYKKELRSYFTSMIGYIFIAFFLIIIGIFFFVQNLLYGSANFEYSLSNITFIFMLLTPILTMRLMAEENRQKTDQLLLTSPLTAEAIVIGKFLAVFSVYMVVVAIICTYPLIMMMYGNVPLLSGYAGILGFALLGGAFLAMGLFISSLAESQVVAAVISFFVFILTYFMDGIANAFPSDNKTTFIVLSFIVIIIGLILYRMMKNLTIAVGLGLIAEAVLTVLYVTRPMLFDGALLKATEWISIIKRFSNFYYGIFDLSSITYYLSIIFIFTFLTTQVIKKKRWS